MVSDTGSRLNRALAGQYAIDREIGRGGMATVYLATDEKHGRQVAIKVFDPELAAQLGGERFLQEIKLTANLQHPHVVALYDSGAADGFLYYVMPFVEGESLRARLDREGNLPPDLALRIARQVATALEYAHDNGVVHRDIKPENILLHGGTVLVADFGIARATAAAAGERLTAVGLAVGTPAYMSPEQASGVSNVDGRSDLYSLGCVLYEMLAGQPPFAGAPQKVLASQVIDPPPQLRETAPHVSPPVCDVAARLLSKAPEERYESAGALTEALDEAASGAYPAATGTWVARTMGELARRRVVHAVAAYAVGSVIALAAVKWAVARFLLSPHLVMFAAVALLSLLPAVALVTYHRRQEGGKWARAVVLGVPVNLAAAGAVLFLMFGGKDLGAATTSVTVEDVEGNVVTRRIPKLEFRKHIAFFFLDNPASDTSLTWLQYAIPWSAAYDLSQNMFLQIQAPDAFAERLRGEGFIDGLNIPLSLMRSQAEAAHLESFATGSVTRRGDTLFVTTRLYDTESGRQQAERSFAGTDPLALVDEVSSQLQEDLGVPATQLELVQDLPAREILTTSPEAFRASIDGMRAFYVQDYAAAAAHLERATTLDSTFAYAQVQLFGTYLLQNRMADAVPLVEAALRNDYKLTEQLRYAIRIGYHRLVKQDTDRAIALGRVQAELFPLDLSARGVLALLYAQQGQYDSAAVQYQEVLALDSSRYEVWRALGELYMQDGRYDEARRYYRRYADRFPDDARAYLDLAGASRQLGELDAALQAYDRASLLDPDDVGAVLGAGRVLMDTGQFEQALARLEEARGLARTANDQYRAIDALGDYYLRRGQVRRAVEFMHMGWVVAADAFPPLAFVQVKLREITAYVRAGDVRTALDSLRSLSAQLTGPFAGVSALGQVGVYIEMELVDSLELAIPRLESMIQQLGVGALNSLVSLARGKAAELRDDCATAIARYQEALSLDPSSLGAYVDVGACHRRLGDLDAAQREIERALERRPAYPRARYELGLVARARGDAGAAERHFRAALDIWREADPVYQPAARAREALAALR